MSLLLSKLFEFSLLNQVIMSNGVKYLSHQYFSYKKENEYQQNGSHERVILWRDGEKSYTIKKNSLAHNRHTINLDSLLPAYLTSTSADQWLYLFIYLFIYLSGSVVQIVWELLRRGDGEKVTEIRKFFSSFCFNLPWWFGATLPKRD